MKDICLELNGSSENPALVGELLGAVGVNIEGLCFMTGDGLTVIHCVVEDAATAKKALVRAGIRIREISDVFVLNKDKRQITGKPGQFGHICRTLADEGILIKFGYPAENNQFVFGVDDIDKVQELLA